VPYGWSFNAATLVADLEGEPARVIRVDRGYCRVATPRGPDTAVIPVNPPTAPAAGDWAGVGGKPLTLTAVAPRSGVLRRRAPSSRREQILAANLDAVWIVLPLDRRAVAGRVERALVAAYEGGIPPRIVLSKADEPRHEDQVVTLLDAISPRIRYHRVAALHNRGVEDLRGHLPAGGTVALLGESGSGKSTLVNALVGTQVQPTGEVRERDRKGRHTTTSRQLIPVPSGGLLLDMPGIREFGVLDAVEGLAKAFPEVSQVLDHCRFSNCTHRGEPGCGIGDAIERGDLTEDRWSRYQGLAAEVAAGDSAG